MPAGCGTGEPSAPRALSVSSQPRFIRTVEWTGKGTWLKADTHIHTKFSDGAHSVEEVIQLGRRFGCDVLAITDHADRHRKAGTHEYHEAIDAARRQYPDLILLAGLEWNLPPWGGDEHATVLIPSDLLDEQGVLYRFKQQFDDLDRVPHRAELADEGLRWLDRHASSPRAKPVVIYEHPSRKRSPSGEIVEDLIRWRDVNDLVIGFAGAPGHQRASEIGGYRGKEKTIDRWDPAAARLGDAWDTLLQRGLDLWAADAPSDFHNANPGDLHDFWPGEFSETWLYVPERSAAGVLRAFRAGTFFGVHGHIVREVELTIEAPGLPRAAGVGEVVELPAGSSFTINLRCRVPPEDWQRRPNLLADIDFIAIEPNSVEPLASLSLGKDGTAQLKGVRVPPRGIVIRARGKQLGVIGPNLLFYTNSIRIRAGS
jgi:hypothetical protein